MPLDSVDEAFKIDFSQTFHELAQQTDTRLSPFVNNVVVSGDSYMVDTVGTVDLQSGNNQHHKIQWSNVPFTRRKLMVERVYAAIPIEDLDTKKMSADPKGPLMRQLMNGWHRKKDTIIARAALADVYTGRNGTTLVTASTDGVLTTDCTSTGVTYEKLLEIDRKWINADVDIMSTPTVLAVTGDEHEDMMLEVELTSGDFTRNYVIEKGQVTQALGHQIVRFGTPASPVLEVVSSVRQCFAMTRGAVTFGVLKDVSFEIRKPDELLDTQVLLVQATIGAVRNEGKLVQKITTTPVA